MNIIFIGGVKFSLDLLKSILENNWSVSSVFSYDDSKKKIYSDFASLDETTSRFNVKHFKVININDENNVEIIKKINSDTKEDDSVKARNKALIMLFFTALGIR